MKWTSNIAPRSHAKCTIYILKLLEIQGIYNIYRNRHTSTDVYQEFEMHRILFLTI